MIREIGHTGFCHNPLQVTHATFRQGFPLDQEDTVVLARLSQGQAKLCSATVPLLAIHEEFWLEFLPGHQEVVFGKALLGPEAEAGTAARNLRSVTNCDANPC